jgi:methenyltetrahydromethanopterin cyclohydrolase
MGDTTMGTMNDAAWRIADAMEADAKALRINVAKVAGCRVIDCGGAVTGSLEAGLRMARACLADLAEVTLGMGDLGPCINVRTDDPIRACLGSQYAGWQVKLEKYFAMGSGPIRAVYGHEEILNEMELKENAHCAVGVLESRRFPTEAVVAYFVGKLPKEVEKLTLLVAPASSIAGTIQVVARSVETALHKLHTLKFDLGQVVSAFGSAPMPPVAADETAAIGVTNDAILYGGRVTLWVRCDDETIDVLGPQVPSSGSKDYGSLFSELFARSGGDFYQIDPLLFSPAEVTFVNLKTGRARTFGKPDQALLRKSFFGE